MAKEVIYTGEVAGKQIEVTNNSWTMKGGNERSEYSIKIFREFEWNGKTCRDYSITLDVNTLDELKEIIEAGHEAVAASHAPNSTAAAKAINFATDDIPF